MGLNQNKQSIPNKQNFHSYYSQTQSQQFFNTHKSFGYRKTNIKPYSLQSILPLISDQSNHLQICKYTEKLIKKKQFQSTLYPYSCVGLLIIKFIEKCIFASGSLIGPNFILTAASNVYDKETNTYPQIIYFVLGINSSQGDIYLIKKDFKIPENYIQQSEGSHGYNYALLQVKQHIKHQQQKEQKVPKAFDYTKSPGLIYGYLGINTNFIGLEDIYIYGYSIDLQLNQQIKFSVRGQKIDKLVCKNGSIAYKIQSSPIQYGSPILIRRHQYYHIVGMHVSGKKQLGTGLQFDQNIRKAINKWIIVKEGHLDLSNKKIDCKVVSLLCSFDWRNLVILNLDNNLLMTDGLVFLTRISWPFLNKLYLCNNLIQKLQFQTHSIKNLQVLYLSKNKIKQIVLISDLSNLRVLELSQNKIEDISQLIHLKYLERIYLNKNRIHKIPNNIDKCGQIKKLQLSRNELSNIPEEVGNLKYLTLLSLDGNRSKFNDNALIKRLLGNNVEVILN